MARVKHRFPNLALLGGVLRLDPLDMGEPHRIVVWLDNASEQSPDYDLHVRVLAVGNLAPRIAALATLGATVQIKGRLTTIRTASKRPEALVAAEEVYEMDRHGKAGP